VITAQVALQHRTTQSMVKEWVTITCSHQNVMQCSYHMLPRTFQTRPSHILNTSFPIHSFSLSTEFQCQSIERREGHYSVIYLTWIMDHGCYNLCLLGSANVDKTWLDDRLNVLFQWTIFFDMWRWMILDCAFLVSLVTRLAYVGLMWDCPFIIW